ncbi:rhamnose utilization protein RhaD (predicted bifunctional aldolase and dehydrogenase)/NAD(P)-dependent dehydrogenase (short-subunit alcohol dehydrogenase family) [Kibdelosporangium banguiense]|uniref:Rhamnose utilization protein RhaD (Predicted bifunctional aldolase and dehydrogenase)/NAD(P)-dependent dehydrogenase (Short-subunit alcohol dehydrogenase family) n=1 Tax=Kibdelosporangium banguiense TaxID=1365924 RepID=A0ABS4THH5_9PSEU|nr:bifunctional aldolase/short-chain dehydrogenase [Kibdelosporangium banguiense]MBP2323880.1 rhamnose utilization protein RhaD (predicted bifunctional aldolase and dehydrogenase)/NAD(P)-dependent dehydrogenase (short-subunit alcohol dehydrogenase family) [Kibdelosporangium banguiense]
MENRWTETSPDPIDDCVRASRLLGAEPDLVLHGGGNTSVKLIQPDITGHEVEVLYVKGSGWDLASIERPGFAPLRLTRLRQLLTLESLPDNQMMNELRCALLDAKAPDPSVETLLHAVLPHKSVLHSHADAVITLTNLQQPLVKEVYGDKVVVVPYVMPGFGLARTCAELFPGQFTDDTIGVVLMNHGLFTFGDTAKEAYDRHIQLVTEAEAYISGSFAPKVAFGASSAPKATMGATLELARLRNQIGPMIVTRHTDAQTMAFVGRPDLADVATRGPATPDHVIRTKRVPLVGRDIDGYRRAYEQYFHDNATAEKIMLDPLPRVILDPELGMLTIGRRAKDADIAADIYRHTIKIIEDAERIGTYQALSAKDLFDMEYWELEQAKLKLAGAPAEFTGETALVTGAASGIGKACVQALRAKGASVIGLDLTETDSAADYLGLQADVTDSESVAKAIAAGVERFGGIDMVVPSAGVFPPSTPIAQLDAKTWRRTLAVNTDAIAELFTQVHPLLKLAPNGGRVVLIASKNVPAPGPGAAAYSASKAAVTQLARVAALEWAPDRIRVNAVHPDAVFDTGVWTPEVLAQRAAHYGLAIEEYKRRNLLRTEVTSAAVGRLVAEMCSRTFAFTTGAQVPIDGGNERVV